MLVLLNPFGTTNWEQNWISWYPLCGTKYIPRIRWLSILTFGALPGIRIALLNTYYNVKSLSINVSILALIINKIMRILISVLIPSQKYLYGLIFYIIVRSYGRVIISI